MWILQLYVGQPGGWGWNTYMAQCIYTLDVATDITWRDSCQVVCFFIGPDRCVLSQYFDIQVDNSFVTCQVVRNFRTQRNTSFTTRQIVRNIYPRGYFIPIQDNHPHPRKWNVKTAFQGFAARCASHPSPPAAGRSETNWSSKACRPFGLFPCMSLQERAPDGRARKKPSAMRWASICLRRERLSNLYFHRIS